jgi:hypothetical protein
MRVQDMQELAQIQADFVSKQAELVGNQTKELAQGIMQGVNEAANATAESPRTRLEAA